MLWWGLDCSCLFEKGVRRERRKPQEGMRQDKPELPDVFTAGDCEKWRDSWHIRKTLEKRSLHSLIFFIMLSSARLSSSTAKFFQFYFHLLMCEHPLGVLLIYTRLYAVVTELCVCVWERDVRRVRACAHLLQIGSKETSLRAHSLMPLP